MDNKKIVNSDKLIQLISAIGLLFMGLSVMYYFVIFLPEQARMDYQMRISENFSDSFISEPVDDKDEGLREKSEFLEILFLQWNIANNLYEFFVETEYVEALGSSASFDDLLSKWDFVNKKKSELLKLQIEHLMILSEACYKNSYCLGSEYGLVALETLKATAISERNFYLSQSIKGENSNLYSQISDELIDEFPNYVKFFEGNISEFKELLNNDELRKIVEYGNNILRLKVSFAGMTVACKNVPEEYKNYARYQIYCVDQNEKMVQDINEIKNAKSASGLVNTCNIEKLLMDTESCSGSENYFKYLKNSLIN